jgi:hypothetical protein
MKTFLCSLALAVMTLAAAPLTHAAFIHFAVNLVGANEVPATPSLGRGTADFTLDTVARTLQGHIVFSGLTGTTTASHIHCCLASPFQTGLNVGVATLVPAFPGFPLGVTSGVDDFTLDLNLQTSYNPAFVTAQGGLANAEAAFIAGLLGNETYLNIHTTTFPGGEIRDGSGAGAIHVARPGTRRRWIGNAPPQTDLTTLTPKNRPGTANRWIPQFRGIHFFGLLSPALVEGDVIDEGRLVAGDGSGKGDGVRSAGRD